MLLEVKNASFSYDGKRKIFENISFSASDGEVTAVIGPNGSGKTTLLRCITDMLRFTDGTCTLDGEDIGKMPKRRLWQRLAYVPQARNVTSSYTVIESVLIGRSSRLDVFASPDAHDVGVAERVLDDLGIYHLRDKKCSRISGGELQMVLIARALASEPEMLILDEPESNLDLKNQITVLEAVKKQSQRGIACIFNTHYPDHALMYADRALMLSGDGGGYRSGASGSVVTEENIRDIFGVNAAVGSFDIGMGKRVQGVIPIGIAKGKSD